MSNQMSNQNSYDTIISLINILNINIDDLYSYCKNQNNKQNNMETIIDNITDNEIIEEIKNDCIIKEEIKNVKIEVKKEEPKRWADYDSDDEEDVFFKPEEVKKDVKETENTEEIKTKTFSEIVKVFEHVEETESDHNLNFIKMEKKIKSKNTIVINNLQEFLDFMRNSPKKEYIINDDAHCSHTFNGTLCPDVKKCKKIHIQRCINGNSCNKKKCTYIHAFNMPNKESETNFIDTMNQYNIIKSKKRVFK